MMQVYVEGCRDTGVVMENAPNAKRDIWCKTYGAITGKCKKLASHFYVHFFSCWKISSEQNSNAKLKNINYYYYYTCVLTSIV